MSSNIEIRRICAWCKQEFIAHKTTTTCCSHRCANLLYKQKKREASIKANNQIVEKSHQGEADCKNQRQAYSYYHRSCHIHWSNPPYSLWLSEKR